jgi:hypothetical protein
MNNRMPKPVPPGKKMKIQFGSMSCLLDAIAAHKRGEPIQNPVFYLVRELNCALVAYAEEPWAVVGIEIVEYDDEAE